MNYFLIWQEFIINIMQYKIPLDVLISGVVGFGITEVADNDENIYDV